MTKEEAEKETEVAVRDILNPEVEAWLLVEDGWVKQQEAKWIPVSTKPGVYAGMKCSSCKAKISYKEFYSGNHNYCYKCGAKMIKED